jgi:hypothetical protein
MTKAKRTGDMTLVGGYLSSKYKTLSSNSHRTTTNIEKLKKFPRVEGSSESVLRENMFTVSSIG